MVMTWTPTMHASVANGTTEFRRKFRFGSVSEDTARAHTNTTTRHFAPVVVPPQITSGHFQAGHFHPISGGTTAAAPGQSTHLGQANIANPYGDGSGLEPQLQGPWAQSGDLSEVAHRDQGPIPRPNTGGDIDMSPST